LTLRDSHQAFGSTQALSEAELAQNQNDKHSMAITIIQIIVAALLVVVILLQVQGGGLSPVFGAGGELYRSRRNVERFLVIATGILAGILAILSLILLIPR